jgi:hypothetical protein
MRGHEGAISTLYKCFEAMIPTRQLDTASPKRLGLRVNCRAVSAIKEIDENQ